MSKTMFLKMQLAEARGKIPQGTAAALTYATILEAGVRGVADGYYGAHAVRQAEESAAKIEQAALDSMDDMLDDIKAITKVYGDVETALRSVAGPKAVMTTSDFPTALALLRTRLRPEETRGRPTWRNWIPERLIGTTPDFKPIRGVKMTELGELKLRPEGTDVQYTKLAFTPDHFMVANYERGIDYTWEMWLNDELSVFVRAARRLGEGGFRTEGLVVFGTVDAGVAREVDITPTRPDGNAIAAARKALALRTITDVDGVSSTGVMRATDIVVGPEYEDDVEVALNTRYQNFAEGKPDTNYRKLTPHVERLWNRVMGTDWIVFDNEVDWIDVRFLEGFQGGPKTYTKMPDVNEYPEEGSFANHAFHLKVGHTLGAKIVEPDAVVRVQGPAS